MGAPAPWRSALDPATAGVLPAGYASIAPSDKLLLRAGQGEQMPCRRAPKSPPFFSISVSLFSSLMRGAVRAGTRRGPR
jgi:hypothetical protein